MSSHSEKEKIRIKRRKREASPVKKAMWRMEYLGHSILEGLIGRLPVAWAHQLGESLAGLIWKFMPLRRRTLLANLRIALGDKHSLSELEVMAEQCFRQIGGNLLSATCTARMKPEQLTEVLKVENPEVIHEAIAEGKGVVLILAHMGNWELLSRMVHFFPAGTKAGAVYRPLNNSIMDAQVLKRREADGTRMFSKRDQFHQIAGFVRDGGVLGVLSDQRVGRGGELTTYFGRLTRISPIPRLLARRTKCRVLSLALVSDGPGHWRARYTPIEGEVNTASCTQVLEQAILESPLDVFWLQRRWKCYIKPKLTLHDWLKSNNERTSKPHRILLWLEDLPQDWQLKPEWIHPDIDYELAMPAGTSTPSGLPEIAQRHELPCDGNLQALAGFLNDIDRHDIRPLDAVLSHCGPAELKKLSDGLAFDHVDLNEPA